MQVLGLNNKEKKLGKQKGPCRQTLKMFVSKLFFKTGSKTVRFALLVVN